MRHLPRSKLAKFVREHRGDHRVRNFSCWKLFICQICAQLSGVDSLRDLETTLRSKIRRLYHLGLDTFSRSTMADASEKRDSEIFENMFNELVRQVQSMAPSHRFKFQNPLYSLDSSTITLCLSMFQWAKFRTRKGALKIHTLRDHRGHLPSAMVITDGNGADITAARRFHFEPDSILVVDRAYVDYCWLYQLCLQGVWWVTRFKKGMYFRILERHTVDRTTGVTSDWRIRVCGSKADSIHTDLRRVWYVDPETGKACVFFTNILHLSAKEITDIYKARWDIELFFKWIKQNLKIKSFFGTS
ncbi:IS4 family transposase [Thermodesulfobacteriota bacterium]